MKTLFIALLAVVAVFLLAASALPQGTVIGIEGAGEYSCIANYADRNGDGILEILYGTGSGLVSVNPVTLATVTLIEGNIRVPVAVGRLDQDGLDDIIVFTWGPNDGIADTIICLFSSGACVRQAIRNASGTSFDVLTSWEHEDDNRPVIVRDLDGDGIDEILAGGHMSENPSAGCVLHFRFNSGSFEVRSTPGWAHHPADLDGDGVSSIYVLSSTDEILVYDASLGGTPAEIDIRQEDAGGGLVSAEPNRGFFSAFDVDGDCLEELVFAGAYPAIDGRAAGHYMWVFDEGHTPIWPEPRQISEERPPLYPGGPPISPFPHHPVFGDLNDDGTLEYVVAVHYSVGSPSELHAWNLADGSPFFTTVPSFPVDLMISPPVLCDIDGNGQIDIVAGGIHMPSASHYLLTWNRQGVALAGYTYVAAGAAGVACDAMFTPLVRDVEGDGYIELAMPVAGGLYYLDEGLSRYRRDTPAPSYRYNQGFSSGLLIFGACLASGVCCGDANSDCHVSVADMYYIRDYVFYGGPAPQPIEAGDANGDGGINTGDIVYLRNYLYYSGPAPTGCAD